MSALLDIAAWYLTAISVGVALLPVIYGFKDPAWGIVPILGICFCVYRSIQELRNGPPGTFAKWAFFGVLFAVVRLIISAKAA